MTLGAGIAGALTGAAPAHAGGWASTVLDPVPDRFEPGRSYTIGFWVLQHGSHPYEGALEPVGLQLVGPDGATTTFTGIALPEPAHYVTSIVIPAAGSYALLGQQGIFQPYRVGTIVAPGAVTALPVPRPLTMRAEDLPWKEIRPPDMPVDPGRNPFDGTAAVPVVNTTATAVGTQAARTASTGMRPTTTVLAVLAATAVILGLLLHRRRRAGVDTRR
jgi:hypothetical protein